MWVVPSRRDVEAFYNRLKGVERELKKFKEEILIGFANKDVNALFKAFTILHRALSVAAQAILYFSLCIFLGFLAQKLTQDEKIRKELKNCMSYISLEYEHCLITAPIKTLSEIDRNIGEILKRLWGKSHLLIKDEADVFQ